VVHCDLRVDQVEAAADLRDRAEELQYTAQQDNTVWYNNMLQADRCIVAGGGELPEILGCQKMSENLPVGKSFIKKCKILV